MRYDRLLVMGLKCAILHVPGPESLLVLPRAELSGS